MAEFMTSEFDKGSYRPVHACQVIRFWPFIAT